MKTAKVVGPLKAAITERTGVMLVMNAPFAEFGIVEVLNDLSEIGVHNTISTALKVLDRTGLFKKEQVEVSGNLAGIFIFCRRQQTTT